MRRVLLTLSGLVAGTTLLISLKSAPGASRLPGQVAADNAAIAALASASATPSGTPAPTSSPRGSAGPGPTAGPGHPTVPPKAPTTTTRPPGAPAPTGPTTPAGPTVIVGDAAVTEFGFVTVGITVANGRITDVIALELPGDEARSVSISAKAGPILRERALAAQNTTFDAVSGATWTSDAYKLSLRSAMTRAGL